MIRPMYPYHGRATDARLESAASTVMTVAIDFLCSALLVGANFPGLPSSHCLMASTPSNDSSVTVRSIITNVAVIFMVPSTDSLIDE